MKKSPKKILRVGVLLCFTLLISGFVLYKAGILEMKSSLHPEDDSQELSAAERDSILIVVDSLEQYQRMLMLSSKSGVAFAKKSTRTILRDSLRLVLDSTYEKGTSFWREIKLNVNEGNKSPLDSFVPTKELLPTSKSGSIFTPDTVSAKLLKHGQSYKPRKTILSSSKSISFIVSPDTDSVIVKQKR